jgi:hypothetical protein
MICTDCPTCGAKCESPWKPRGQHIHYHIVKDAKDARGKPVWHTHNWSDSS